MLRFAVVLFFIFKAQKFASGEEDPLVTNLVYFDVSVESKPAGRIIFGLFGDVAPKTVENFLRLTVHDKGYGYTGSRFVRVLKTYKIQGGAFDYGNKTGGISWFGAPFAHENYKLQHYGPGWVSMSSVGPDSISSQFHIITDELYGTREWFDNRYVVFSAVVHGMNLVHKIEQMETFGLVPVKRIIVDKCGTLQMSKLFTLGRDYITEDIVSYDGKLYE